jgi:hypothetical protein
MRKLAYVVLLSSTLLAILVAAVPVLRHAALRGAGWALVAQDPKERVDIIAIANDAVGAGVLEAADLVHEGIASRVLVFSVQLTPAAAELARRGVPHHDAAAEAAVELHALGVRDIEQIEKPAAGTEEESRILPQWCSAHGIRSVAFVSTTDHSRRTRRGLQRAMRGRHITVIVRYARYSDFDPNAWWHTRSGVRTELMESEKLLLDLLRHPFG